MDVFGHRFLGNELEQQPEIARESGRGVGILDVGKPTWRRGPGIGYEGALVAQEVPELCRDQDRILVDNLVAVDVDIHVPRT